MAITWTDVTDIASELSTVAAGKQTAILAQVEAQMNADVWGDLLDIGAVYLAAHLATVSARRGAAGSVMSESVGSISRSYANSVAQGSAQLASTSYGVEFERLMLTLPSARFLVC